MIRTMFDSNPKQMCSALSVYDALTEIASDEQRESFEAGIAHIANYAGLSVSTVGRLLPLLEELSLITIRQNDRAGSRLKAPNTYTLLPIGHHDLSIGQQPSRCRPRVEESKKNKKKRKTQVLLRKDLPLPFFEDGDSVEEDQLEGILYFNAQLVPLGWEPVTKLSAALEKALKVFDADRIRELVDGVAEHSPDVSVPKRKTLVRLLWENYR